jgi:hypothetical protein
MGVDDHGNGKNNVSSVHIMLTNLAFSRQVKADCDDEEKI